MIHKIYEKFLGKFCTILTGPISFPFTSAEQHADFFSGILSEVNIHGVFIKNSHTNTLAFYSFPLVGIIDEQVVYASDPNFNKIKAEIEQRNNPKPTPTNVLSIEEMTQMAKEIKAKKSLI